MILDLDIFNSGKLQIIGANEPTTGEGKRLISIIENNEKNFLYSLLGGMASDYMSGLNESTIDQKWVDLRDGAEFTLNGKTVKFQGLNYIEAHYMWGLYNELVTETTRNGEMPIVDSVNNSYKQVLIWNDMVDLISNNLEYVPSLANFLDAGDYQDYTVLKLEYKNQFGL